FLNELAAKGLDDDTLIIVTSDESRALFSPPESINSLSHHWGPLVIMTPEKDQALVDEKFVQSDIPLSMSDYLGVKDAAVYFNGRSIFRDYGDKPRRLMLTTPSTQRVAMID